MEPLRGRITRHALKLLAKQDLLAKGHLQQIRSNLVYEPPRCSGVFTNTMGIPCSHRLIEVEQQGVTLQVTEFHVHWWVDRSQATTEDYTSNRVLEPRVIRRRRTQNTSHRRGAGVRGNCRDPSLFERFDPNVRTAAPPDHMPQRFVNPPTPPPNFGVQMTPQVYHGTPPATPQMTPSTPNYHWRSTPTPTPAYTPMMDNPVNAPSQFDPPPSAQGQIYSQNSQIYDNQRYHDDGRFRAQVPSRASGWVARTTMYQD